MKGSIQIETLIETMINIKQEKIEMEMLNVKKLKMLFRASSRGDLNTLIYLLEKEKIGINSSDEFSNTPLHLSIQNKHVNFFVSLFFFFFLST